MSQNPKVNIRFLYVMCNDVKEIRKFYSELLGLKETSFADTKEMAWVAYKCEGLEYMFFKWDKPLPIHEEWNWQPGDAAGKGSGMSISIETSADDYKATVKRLKEAKVKAMSETPTWRQASYWGWTVKDPMGNTIEVYTTPREQPAKGETPVWKD